MAFRTRRRPRDATAPASGVPSVVRLVCSEAADATWRPTVAALDQLIVKPEVLQVTEVEIYFLNQL